MKTNSELMFHNYFLRLIEEEYDTSPHDVDSLAEQAIVLLEYSTGVPNAVQMGMWYALACISSHTLNAEPWSIDEVSRVAINLQSLARELQNLAHE